MKAHHYIIVALFSSVGFGKGDFTSDEAQQIVEIFPVRWTPLILAPVIGVLIGLVLRQDAIAKLWPMSLNPSLILRVLGLIAIGFGICAAARLWSDFREVSYLGVAIHAATMGVILLASSTVLGQYPRRRHE